MSAGGNILFQGFDIETKLVCWDDNYFYLEQKITRNGFVHCVAVIKQVVSINPYIFLYLNNKTQVIGASPEDVLKQIGVNEPRPDLPKKLVQTPPFRYSNRLRRPQQSWVSYDEQSSYELRADSKDS